MADSLESDMSRWLLQLNRIMLRPLYSRLKKFRGEASKGGVPVLYLNAGDTYTGTPWFSLYKDKIVSSFLNLLRPDAIVTEPSILTKTIITLSSQLTVTRKPRI